MKGASILALLSELPRLRLLDLIPVSTEKGPMVCLRDPERYASVQALVPRDAIPILALMDGSRTLRDIQADYARATGDIVPSDELRALADRLDELLFLDSPSFRSEKEKADRAFLLAERRPPALAGLSYPDDPVELGKMIDAFFTHADGPGPVDRGRDRPLRAALAPHIDYARGGPAYAHAYKSVVEGARGIDTFVILATAHQPTRGIFALTRKDFDTPFGVVATERGLVDELARSLAASGVDPFADELSHRSEHSAEFQVIMLAHLLARDRPVSIVPVLVGSLQPILEARGDARAHPEIAAFTSGLARILEARAGRTMVIGGVDLAHVGPQFGDGRPVTEGDLARVRREDLGMLAEVGRGDAAAFWQGLARDGDARRICGFPPMMTMLLSMALDRGELLRYAQWHDPNGSVTFCGMAFPA